MTFMHPDGGAGAWAEGPLLELDADRAPEPPPSLRNSLVLGVRLPRHQAVWVKEQALLDRTTVNGYLTRLVRDAYHHGEWLPRDVREWLTIQASQMGCPGEPEAALVGIIRHLADRYPNGARLR